MCLWRHKPASNLFAPLCVTEAKMADIVKVLTIEELQTMHTGALMKRRAALLKCEESFELSDRNGYENKSLKTKTEVIEFKNTLEWKKAYTDIKSVLNTREHYPNKKERKEIRQNKARNSK